MQLVDSYCSPFARRVAAMLETLGIGYDIRPLPRSRAGEVLAESAATVDHPDQLTGPERALTPPGGGERRSVQRQVALTTGALRNSITVLYERPRRPAALGYEPRAARCEEQASAGLAVVDAIEPAPVLAGGQLTQADITAVVSCEFLPDIAPALSRPECFPRLDRLVAYRDSLRALMRTGLEAA